MNMDQLTFATKLAILFSGIYLWIGMLTGLWKYYQIRKSAHSRAHPYVDIAHRSSLLYAPATLILATLGHFTIWSDYAVLTCIGINILFFSLSILSYILHGVLKDTVNQFQVPHQLGKWYLPKILMTIFMFLLVIGELVASGFLIIGTAYYFGFI
ncbi:MULTISPECIES: hypothetical protein [Acinetobacter]|jgi:hypothetical protein|uniref:Uncharacterized protein n=2 Tax=Acinetobacter TaxID=469 RepID=A0A8H2K5W0_ACIRA|nr:MULTISPECIES: hypothetical protein [Acinetobacter]EXB35137.1 putative membrane protein [Acinetobacter sp. 1461402]EXB74174.1 putative membrane protein [Acinetobacter sp. 230853]MDK8754120.1 hypothetical protein [Acinetobacter radioresistens]PKD80068.1 hypothetical protein CW313_14455 [Acinetobacter radioresistens]PSD36350.1 hypothetical protein C7E16_08145 [Acinetobacter radioresistens]